MSFPRPFLTTLRATTKTTPLRAHPLRQTLTRRTQSTTAAAEAPSQSSFSKLWNSHVGPKTVHFWAPVMKWGLALAGAADFARPAEALSLQQNCALMVTGMIWTRWCFVIRPKNYLLAAVNFILFCVGATQVTRVLRYQASLKGESVGAEVRDAAKEEAQLVKGAVEDPKGAVKKAEQNA